MSVPRNENSEHLSDLLGVVVDEYLDRRASGEQPDIDDYVARYPQLGDVIRQSLRALEMVDASNTSAGQSSVSADRTAPKQLGDFRLLRELGRGGMGVVYEAEQISLNRKVALKVLPFAALIHNRALQRFHNEVRAVAALDHPNIVSVYSVGEEHGVHYYAMQLIRGYTLARIISGLKGLDESGVRYTTDSISQLLSEPPLPAGTTRDKSTQNLLSAEQGAVGQAGLGSQAEARAGVSSLEKSETDVEYFRSVAHLGIQVANALQHAHDQGVLHRDIKPGNLLLDDEMQLYVTDFGLARIESDAGVTMTGDIVGTLRYMAPEQALGNRVVVDQRADVYSLGVTLYELLTLRPAFDAVDRKELLRQIAFEDPPKPRMLRRSIPRDLETIILKAIEKNRGDRYSSAAEAAGDLRAFCEYRPIRAKPATLVQRAGKWSRRHRPLVTALFVACSLLVCGSLALLVIHSREMTRHALEVEAALSEKSWALTDAQAARLAAEKQRLRAERNELVARRRNYLSDMQLAFERRSQLMLSEAARLLDRIVPRAGEQDVRGLEWDILNAQIQAEMQVLGVHSGAATECVLFPDGRTAASVGEDGLVHIYNLQTKNRLRTFSPRIGPIHSLAISPNGGTLAVGGSPTLQLLDLSRVYLLDAQTGERKSALHRHDTTIESIVFSPDGKHVASGARYEDVKVSDTEGKLLQTLTAKRRNESLAFSPDGSQLVALWDRAIVRSWDWSSGRVSQDLVFPQQRTFSQLALSPDGTLLVVCNNDFPYIDMFDTATGRLCAALSAQTRQPRKFTAVAFSLDGSRVVAADSDGRIHHWPVETKVLLRASTPLDLKSAVQGQFAASTVQDTAVTSVQPLNNGGVLSTAADGSVKYSMPFSQAARIVELTHDVTSAVFAHNGRLYLASSDGTVRLFDLVSESGTTVLNTSEKEIADLTVCEDNSQLAVIYRSGALDVFDIESGKVSWSPKERSEYSRWYRTVYSPDGRFLATTGNDNTFRVWDTQRRSVAFSQRLSANGPAVAFSPSGELVACGNDRIRIFEVSTGRMMQEEPGGQNTRWMQFSSDGKLLASAHWDGSIRLYHVPSSRTQLLREHRGAAECLAFSPDGRSLVSADNFGRLLIWDVETGELFGELLNPLPPSLVEVDYRILISNDYLITFDSDAPHARIAVWKLTR